MLSFNQVLDAISATARADMEAATYFILETCSDWGDNVLLTSVEDAEGSGFYAIHVGMADRPDSRMMLIADSLAEALDKLEGVRAARPEAGLWFSSLEILAQIKHANLARGVVLARGSVDPDNDEDEWSIMAAHIAECEVSGLPLDMSINTSDVIDTIADRLV